MAAQAALGYANVGAQTIGDAGSVATVVMPEQVRRVVYIRREKAPLALRLLYMVLTAAVSVVLTACIGLAVVQRLGYQPYAIVSGSMEPEIPVGSLVFANTNVDFNSDLEGRVIAFRSTGPVVVHRAVEMTDDGIVTQGDANDQPDGGYVGPGNYIGSVEVFIPWAGVAFTELGTKEGVIALGLLVLAVFALGFAKRHWGRKRVVRGVIPQPA